MATKGIRLFILQSTALIRPLAMLDVCPSIPAMVPDMAMPSRHNLHLMTGMTQRAIGTGINASTARLWHVGSKYLA